MHLDECAIACELAPRIIRPCAAPDTTALAQAALSRIANARPNRADRHVSCGANHAKAFCTLLVNGSAPQCLNMIAKLEPQGLTYAALVDKLFAPAARELGKKWNDSDLSFSEVSAGISTLFLVNASLRSRTVRRPHGLRKHILFFAQPHEAHSLGVILAAEAFRRHQWDVEMLVNASNDTVLDCVSRSQVALVGVSAGRDSTVDSLFSLCARLSKFQRPPVVLLGGTAARTKLRKFPEACTLIDSVGDALRHADRAVRH